MSSSLLFKQQSHNLVKLEDAVPEFLRGKRVLLRVDFNVPLTAEGFISDVTRILQHGKTIEFLRRKGALPIIITHLGQPKTYDAALSFKPLITQISKILGLDIVLFEAIEDVKLAAYRWQNSVHFTAAPPVFMLDNLRFFAGEVANSLDFAEELAKIGDLYVNDAFSCSHRAHASIITLPKLLPSYMGLALAAELANLQRYLGYMHSDAVVVGEAGGATAERMGPTLAVGGGGDESRLDAYTWPPIAQRIAIVGGKKVETKLPLLKALSKKVGTIIIVGGIANSFLDYLGFSLGDVRNSPEVNGILASFFAEGQLIHPWGGNRPQIKVELLQGPISISDTCAIVLPCDLRYCSQSEWAVLRSNTGDAEEIKAKIASPDAVPNDAVVLDIGPRTAEKIGELLVSARTVMWNGPAGYFEDRRFAEGTLAIARKLIEYGEKNHKRLIGVQSENKASADALVELDKRNSYIAGAEEGEFAFSRQVTAAKKTPASLVTVVGGGDSLAVFNMLDCQGNLREERSGQRGEEGPMLSGGITKNSAQNGLSYACTGGGAFLEWLAGDFKL